eukprot:gnl/MRDRNA2_/MRDRNA2_113828_c0_seq1.p1 gnl/MRDRNA2_/MRDRNA2_113828_c0~~gnl/MRDRNA2_/MRDRNA2_113828_c0_seq1.p1  ORF type:complete len:709 (+),score=228.87 gnl/MRDRNA2_/MRDRNA2_113828_c0_seq1:184-2127(+)
MAARGSMGFSFGGLGLPRPDTPAALAVWKGLVGEQEEEKGPGVLSLLESGSAAKSESSAQYSQRMQAGARMMRTAQGKQMLQFGEQFAIRIEKEAKEAEEKMHAMMDKLMGMTMEERQSHLAEYQKLKASAAIAKQAHADFDTDTDLIYKEMAKYPDEQMMDPANVAFDNTVDKEFEELLHDPKMQSMLQMSEDKAPSSFLESSAEAQQMLSIQVTAEGRVGSTGVDEEGSEEQGAAQAAELLKMFDVHVGHYGSAPTSLTSFIQTHDSLTEQQREAAQAKALLQRRVSQAMSRSAQIDKLLDDAIMDYLSDPKEVEEKPSVIEEIAGAFRSNSDPLHLFYEHPFILRYRQEQKQNAILPPRPVQRQLLDSLLTNAPANMKMAVIHADLDAPDASELKIQQDLNCMKKISEMMKKSNLDAHGKDGELRVFIDVQGGRAKNNERIAHEIERALEAGFIQNQKVRNLKELGDQTAQDYATGLADFVFRVGEGQLSNSQNRDLAAFKVEALKRGGIVKADASKSSDDMCTLDDDNLEVATSKVLKKFTRINKIVKRVDLHNKEKKLLSETERWAQQQRRVEHNHKSHGKASVDVDFEPVKLIQGFANLLKKGRKEEQVSLVQLHENDRHESPRKRRGPNYGLYTPRAKIA